MGRLEEAAWAATYIDWESIEDDYNEGEGDESYNVLMESIFITARTPDELIEELASRYGLPDRKDYWTAFDGRLELTFLVNDDNIEADDRDIEQWKAGRKRLWAAHVSVRIVRVAVRSVSTSEIAKAFRVENMGD